MRLSILTVLFGSAFLALSYSVNATSVSTHSSDMALSKSVAYLPPIESLVPYSDVDYDFSLAVPEGWSRIITIGEDSSNSLDEGYAVGFESARSHADDKFADYIMIELLPGGQTGAFATDGTQTDVAMVNGRPAITDIAHLTGFELNHDKLDLLVFQAEIVEPGYTVGIYVIGERIERVVLEDAFKLVLKTLKLPEDPFSVS